jgi:hypothetical protein
MNTPRLRNLSVSSKKSNLSDKFPGRFSTHINPVDTKGLRYPPSYKEMKMIPEMLESLDGYDDWSVDSAGRLRCPHGHICEPDQRNGLGECGCISPLAQEGF